MNLYDLLMWNTKEDIWNTFWFPLICIDFHTMEINANQNGLVLCSTEESNNVLEQHEGE